VAGGPWVTGEKSMKHLVYSLVQVGDDSFHILRSDADETLFRRRASPELKQKMA
jgi:hypothetical protein